MHTLQHVNDTRTLACNQSFALVSTFVPGLAQTALVQVVGTTFGWRRRYSLYVVYREAGTTFDAIATLSFDPGVERVGNMLARFVHTEEFASLFVGPLVEQVRRHFGRCGSSDGREDAAVASSGPAAMRVDQRPNDAEQNPGAAA